MLLNSTLDIKEFYGTLVQNTSFKTLKPFVKQAQIKYLLPFIGSKLLTELEDGIVPNDTELSTITLTDKKLELYELLAASLAYYTMLDTMPFLNVSEGNNGVMEQNAQNMAPARQWVYFENEKSKADNADRLLDQALAFLEANADAFPSWKNSAAYTFNQELFISNTADLSRYINIQGSRRAFLAFRPYIQRAEELYIKPELEDELYTDLKKKLLQPGNLTEEDRKLILLIKPALAQLAFQEALPGICFQVFGNGIRVLAENDSIRSRLNATDAQVSALEVKAIELSNIYLADLRRTLDTILQTGEANPGDKQQTWQPTDNNNSTSFWV